MTLDGRYLVVEGKQGPRLWRATNPNLSQEGRAHWVALLMDARRAAQTARGDPAKLAEARRTVDLAKRALGERGQPWWNDRAPDLNRVLVKNSPYRDWWSNMIGCEPRNIERSR